MHVQIPVEMHVLVRDVHVEEHSFVPEHGVPR